MVFVGIDSVILLAGCLLFMAALMASTAIITDGAQWMFERLLLEVPGFGYTLEGGESGNALFGVYAQLRWVALGILAACMILSLALNLRKAAARAAFLCIMILVFPPLWDYLAGVAAMGGSWILGSCGPSCSIWAMLTPPPVHEPSGYHSILEFVVLAVPGGAASWMAEMLQGLLGSILMVNVVLAGAITGIILDLMAGLLTGALPLLAILSMAGRLGRFCDRLLAAAAPILLAPILSATILVVGSHAVSGYGGPAAWLGAAAVVLLASILPLAAVPFASAIVHDAAGATVSSLYQMVARIR